jgi:Domain of unknown function (DUF3560)
MGRHFIHDLETQKLHVHTAGKADWLTIPEADRETIKRACLWSNRLDCWVSRCKGSKTRILAHFYPSDVLTRNGFEDRGEQGEKLSFADQVEASQEKAEARAERMEGRAEKAGKECTARNKAADAIAGVIPFGQPILVGHHSEKRHRRDLAKIDGHMRKAFEANEKRDHYERRAETARNTAEGTQYSNPAFLGRRIAEQEAEERRLLHRLEGNYAHSEAEAISDEYQERLTGILEEVQDKLGFYRHCLATCGAKVWDKASLKGMAEVKIRGGWERIVKLNPKTVSVPNICFPEEASQIKWALKYPYSEVQDAR